MASIIERAVPVNGTDEPASQASRLAGIITRKVPRKGQEWSLLLKKLYVWETILIEFVYAQICTLGDVHKFKHTVDVV